MIGEKDEIKESWAARWAWRVTIVPLLGFVLFIPLAFLALLQFGRGQTGFWLLGKGLIRNLWMTLLGLLIPATYWFCPKWDYDDSLQGYDGKGYVMRRWEYPGKYVKVGKWTYHYKQNNNEDYFLRKNIDFGMIIIIEGKYWDDKLSGIWTCWNESGQRVSEGNFVNGKAEDKWGWWHDSGSTFCSGEFKNGNPVGHWTWWWPNGQKLAEGIADKRSQWTFWFQDGQLQGSGEMINLLSGVFKKYFKDDPRICSPYILWLYETFGGVEVLDEYQIGKWTTFYMNGSKKQDCENMGGSKINGKKLSWYKNGCKQEEGQYKDGEKTGKWTVWHNSGNIKEEGQYDVYGERTGKWTFWHSSGNIKAEGLYDEGYLTGKWLFWHENGTVKARGAFDWTVDTRRDNDPNADDSINSPNSRGADPTKIGKWQYWSESGEYSEQDYPMEARNEHYYD